MTGSSCIRSRAAHGGPCPGCPDGQACVDPDDCQSGLCGAGVCVGQECQVDFDCGALTGTCTRGVCDSGSHTCVSVPDHEGDPCDDDDPCTVADVCTDGACAPGPPLDCSEFDSACTIGQCDPDSGAFCTHRDVLPFAGKEGFVADSWCPDCGFYKLRRTPKKREYPSY